jgi:hypothetical protein
MSCPCKEKTAALRASVRKGAQGKQDKPHSKDGDVPTGSGLNAVAATREPGGTRKSRSLLAAGRPHRRSQATRPGSG